MAVLWLALAAPLAVAETVGGNDAAVDRVRPALSVTDPDRPRPAVPLVAIEPVEEAAPPDLDLDPATLDNVIAILEDDARRQEVLDTLRALQAVEEPPAPEVSLFARPMEWLRQNLDQRTDALLDLVDSAVASLENIQLFGDWLTLQITSPLRRAFWANTFRDLGLVLGISIAVSIVAARLLRRPRAVFKRYAPPTPFHLAAGIALHGLVRLVPVALFVGVALLVGAILQLGPFTTAVAAALVQGLAFVTAVTVLIRVVLNFQNPNMQLFAADPKIGQAVQRNLIRLVAIGGYGYFGLEAARALGLPWALHGFSLHILFLLTFFLYVRMVLRFREEGAHGFEALASAGTAGLLGRFLPWDRVARIWHFGAILFGLVIYGAWALQVPGGPLFLLRAMLLMVAILAASRLIHVWLSESNGGGATGKAGDDGEESDLTEVLTSAAQSPLTFFWRLLTTLVTLALILQVWGIDVVGLLASETARSLRNALATSAITLGLAYLVWKLASVLIRSLVEEKDDLGRLVRSNRSRTLLTISRNLIFVLVWITAGLMVLSELGVNLAPLLAGAGVIGLAIGFGSQQLVRDIITGLFILIEDTVSVGDVAELGGKAGVVEAVSLRTVRLRSYDGQVHTIPYSSIDTISNFTKEYSYYVFDVGVAYKENTDRVIEVMREIGAEMQRERAYRRLILEPLDVAGVDRFADSAVVIRARIKTRPLQQWTVGREFNRRLKQRFDALGIEIPFPQRTLHMIDPRPQQPAAAGQAAPASAAE
ncbi:MAG: hypothetical protein EA356_08680 [Geminicoccaceae bacterium]|nr:MAG: hypothetical protein EA356_08680 [Geminicoccaceae bacterium]